MSNFLKKEKPRFFFSSSVVGGAHSSLLSPYFLPHNNFSKTTNMVRIPPSNDQLKSYRRRRRKLKTPSSIKEILGAASSGALVTLLTSSLLWSSGDLEQIRIQRQSFLRRSNLNPFLLQKNVVDNALYGNRLIVPAAETNHKHDDRHSNSAYDHIWPKVAWLMSFPNR